MTTRTEQIAHATCDRHGVGLPPEVENLGRLAAELEFWAAQPEIAYWERAQLTARAAEYRKAQFDLLEQLQGEGYAHANVLDEGPNTSEKPGMFSTWPAALAFLGGIMLTVLTVYGIVIAVGKIMGWL